MRKLCVESLNLVYIWLDCEYSCLLVILIKLVFDVGVIIMFKYDISFNDIVLLFGCLFDV